MAKVNWPTQEAERIRIKDDEPVLFQTGYGPSGLPHIGTFAEVARTQFVMEAFKKLHPDQKIELIVFSDDMDGLRNLPENIPNHDLLREHLGAPLTTIPDPYQKENSFAGYMNAKLQHFLDYYGFNYRFISSTDAYKNGMFNDGLEKVMDNYETIHKLFTKTIAQDKRDSWSPFFPICEKCGKIYTTTVTDLHPASYELSYSCNKDEDNYSSCGHTGRVSIKDGRVKVGWKVDWALRWFTLGINYEMHGKDLMDSATLSSKICRVLGGTAPTTYKYELFLDENGAKISKKIGNGVSMEEWQTYSPLGALLYLLLEKPNKARKMGLPIMSRIVDTYLKALRSDDQEDQDSQLWYIDQLLHHHDASGLDKSVLSNSDTSYSLLVNVASALGNNDAELLYDYAQRYDAGVAQNEQFFRELCDKVVAFVQHYESKQVETPPTINQELMHLLPKLRAGLEPLMTGTTASGEELQTMLFTIAKENGVEPREWFGFLYATLLNKSQGPRLGSFFAMLGWDRVSEMIDNDHFPIN